MRHIPEESLAQYAYDPSGMVADVAAETRAHLATCTLCADTYESFLIMLADEDDDAFLGSDGTAATIAYGARMAAENRDAEELLKDFLSEPEKLAFRNLAAQRKYLHGGIVRRLAQQAFDVCASEPLDALTFADAAISVAEAIPDEAYPLGLLYDLRGRAYKEQANALNRLGEPASALEALARSERMYQRLEQNRLALSNVALVRASAYFLLERLDDADQQAAIAEEGYTELRDTERRTKAQFLRGNIRYETRQLESASTLFQSVIAYGEATGNEEWVAKGSYALGNCAVEAGDVEEAAFLFSTALVIFRHTGPETDCIGAEWGMARIALARGLFKDALHQLNGVHHQFKKRGMTLDAAVAGLDIIEANVALRLFKQAARVARKLFEIFTDAGLLTSSLTALSYIEETAVSERLTREDVQEVRRFLKRVDRQPHLLFVRPERNR